MGNETAGRAPARGLMGPVVLITLGGLWLAHTMGLGRFGDLWPVILIVIGLVKLFESMTAGGGPSAPGGQQPPGGGQ
jgi:hypothetical protein